jgi:hypothetical protein
MPNVVMRVWLPDRPGALGAVASRIGAVKGDLVGIDILERGGGRAIDELVVSIPDGELVDLLVREVMQVEGVDVEEVRPALDTLRDPRLDALETAAALVEERTIGGLLRCLVAEALQDFDASWAIVLDIDSAVALATAGEAPPSSWVGAFVHGSRSSVLVATGAAGPDDVAWGALASSNLALVLGRPARPFRARERRQLAALARIADGRWAELVLRASKMAHPSAV